MKCNPLGLKQLQQQTKCLSVAVVFFIRVGYKNSAQLSLPYPGLELVTLPVKTIGYY